MASMSIGSMDAGRPRKMPPFPPATRLLLATALLGSILPVAVALRKAAHLESLPKPDDLREPYDAEPILRVENNMLEQHRLDIFKSDGRIQEGDCGIPVRNVDDNTKVRLRRILLADASKEDLEGPLGEKVRFSQTQEIDAPESLLPLEWVSEAINTALGNGGVVVQRSPSSGQSVLQPGCTREKLIEELKSAAQLRDLSNTERPQGTDSIASTMEYLLKATVLYKTEHDERAREKMCRDLEGYPPSQPPCRLSLGGLRMYTDKFEMCPAAKEKVCAQIKSILEQRMVLMALNEKAAALEMYRRHPRHWRQRRRSVSRTPFAPIGCPAEKRSD